MTLVFSHSLVWLHVPPRLCLLALSLLSLGCVLPLLVTDLRRADVWPLGVCPSPVLPSGSLPALATTASLMTLSFPTASHFCDTSLSFSQLCRGPTGEASRLLRSTSPLRTLTQRLKTGLCDFKHQDQEFLEFYGPCVVFIQQAQDLIHGGWVVGFLGRRSGKVSSPPHSAARTPPPNLEPTCSAPSPLPIGL